MELDLPTPDNCLSIYFIPLVPVKTIFQKQSKTHRTAIKFVQQYLQSFDRFRRTFNRSYGIL